MFALCNLLRWNVAIKFFLLYYFCNAPPWASPLATTELRQVRKRMADSENVYITRVEYQPFALLEVPHLRFYSRIFFWWVLQYEKEL